MKNIVSALCVAGFASLPISAWAMPTITEFTVNGQSAVTVPVGGMLNFKWASTGGIASDSFYTTSASCPGGPGPTPWIVNGASGDYSFPANTSLAGCTYVITYEVYDGVFTARASISVTVAEPFGFGALWGGPWRTEFLDPRIGTLMAPFEVTSYDRASGEFRTTYKTFANSYAKTNNPGGWSVDRDMLVVVANNDVSTEARCEEGASGPPDQTAAINEVDGGGLFGVSVSYSPSWKAKIYTLQVNNNFQICSGGTPYLGIGTFYGNGSSTPAGILNRPDGKGGVTDLWVQLERYLPGKSVGTQPVTGTVHAVAVAEWNGKKYMLQVNLFSDGIDWHGLTLDWKWPYRQSSYFPGARVGYLEGAKVGIPSLPIAVPRQVSLDWNALYRVADDLGLWGIDRLPRDNEVPITSFQISVEVTGMDPTTPSAGTNLILSVWGVSQKQ